MRVARNERRNAVHAFQAAGRRAFRRFSPIASSAFHDHVFVSLSHKSNYDMCGTDQCLKLVFFYELETESST